MIDNLLGEEWRHITGNYYVSNCGRFKRIGKTKEWLLHPYLKISKGGGKRLLIKINGKEKIASRIIYETFIGRIPEGYIVHHKDHHFRNNDLLNLEIITRQYSGHITGGRTSRRKLIYDIDNQCFYKGTREAGRMLHISRQTVSDYCNKKVKRPMFHLRWAREDE